MKSLTIRSLTKLAIELAGAAATGCFCISSALAGVSEYDIRESSQVRINPVLAAGLTGGGDTIASYPYVYLGEAGIADIDLGDTVFLYGGIKLFWPQRHLGLIVQGGLFAGGVGDTEASADFTRWPVELIGFYSHRKFRVGVGVTRHFSPVFEETGIGNARLEFDDASGWLTQLEYVATRFSTGIRHVQIDYAINSSEFSGDHWGLFGSYQFGSLQ